MNSIQIHFPTNKKEKRKKTFQAKRRKFSMRLPKRLNYAHLPRVAFTSCELNDKIIDSVNRCHALWVRSHSISITRKHDFWNDFVRLDWACVHVCVCVIKDPPLCRPVQHCARQFFSSGFCAWNFIGKFSAHKRFNCHLNCQQNC